MGRESHSGHAVKLDRDGSESSATRLQEINRSYLPRRQSTCLLGKTLVKHEEIPYVPARENNVLLAGPNASKGCAIRALTP